MPDLSITIMSPMPGAVVTPSCPVSGTFVNAFRPKEAEEDRNYHRRTTSTISVTVTKNGTSYGSFTVTTSGTQWQASSSTAIPDGTGYTITASITDGTNTASNSIETVDVATTPVIQITTITPPPGPKIVFPLAKKPHDFEGKYDPAGADSMFGFVYTLLILESTTTSSSGAKHYHARFFPGTPADMGDHGDLDKPNKKWKLKNIDVEQGQFVMVFLKQGTVTLGKNTSRLF